MAGERANLRYADLSYADLSYAKIFDDTRLDTGETWGEYKAQTVPALLTAGGKTLEAVAAGWDCHSWHNCPLHIAFDAPGIEGIPILLRPCGEQFLRFFDAHILPNPCPSAGTCTPGDPT